MPPPSIRPARGFSLIELLVAVAVMGLVLLLVSQITQGVTRVVNQGGRRIDADSQARLVFDRMGVDISRMLKRSDIDPSAFKQPASTPPAAYAGMALPANPQPGNDRMAFYSEADGYFSGGAQPPGAGKAAVSLVAYQVANDPYSQTPVLRRMGKGLGWEPDTAGTWQNIAYLPIQLASRWPALFGNDPDYKTLGDQVFRMEYAYLLKATSRQAARLSLTPWDPSSHTWAGGFKDVAAIVVTLGVLDNTSRTILTDYSHLVQALPDAVEGADVAAAWSAVVAAPGFAATAGIPRDAAAAVRVYERYFYLSPSP